MQTFYWSGEHVLPHQNKVMSDGDYYTKPFLGEVQTIPPTLANSIRGNFLKSLFFFPDVMAINPFAIQEKGSRIRTRISTFW